MNEIMEAIVTDYNALKPTAFKGIARSDYELIEARVLAANSTMFDMKKLAKGVRDSHRPPVDPVDPRPVVIDERVDTETTVVILSGEPTGQEQEVENPDDPDNPFIEMELEDAEVTYETYRTYEIYSDGSEKLIDTTGAKEVSRTGVDLYWEIK